LICSVTVSQKNTNWNWKDGFYKNLERNDKIRKKREALYLNIYATALPKSAALKDILATIVNLVPAIPAKCATIVVIVLAMDLVKAMEAAFASKDLAARIVRLVPRIFLHLERSIS